MVIFCCFVLSSHISGHHDQGIHIMASYKKNIYNISILSIYHNIIEYQTCLFNLTQELTGRTPAKETQVISRYKPKQGPFEMNMMKKKQQQPQQQQTFPFQQDVLHFIIITRNEFLMNPSMHICKQNVIYIFFSSLLSCLSIARKFILTSDASIELKIKFAI